MGIYPTHSIVSKQTNPDGSQTWLETKTTPGLVQARWVTAAPWHVEARTNCYCCSCPDEGGQDPYCRNHGFAGTRPCEEHNMPGQEAEGPNGENLGMPTSVQQARAGND